MTVKGFSKASFFHIVELLRRMSHKSESPHETEKDRTLRMLDGNIVLCSVKDKEPEAEQAHNGFAERADRSPRAVER